MIVRGAQGRWWLVIHLRGSISIEMEGPNQRDHSCGKEPAWFLTWFCQGLCYLFRPDKAISAVQTCFKKSQPAARGFGFAHFSGYGDFLSGSTGANNGFNMTDKKPNLKGGAWVFTLFVVFSKKRNYIDFFVLSAFVEYNRYFPINKCMPMGFATSWVILVIFCFVVGRFESIHPVKLTLDQQKWRFGSDDFPFQLGDL